MDKYVVYALKNGGYYVIQSLNPSPGMIVNPLQKKVSLLSKIVLHLREQTLGGTDAYETLPTHEKIY